MTGKLHGKAAVVTGATGGIGTALCRRFAAEGAQVVVHGRRESACRRLVDELRRGGARAEFVAGDISEERTSDLIVAKAVEMSGGIDILALNAGAIAYGQFWETSPEEFDTMMSVNVRGPWLTARAAREVLTDGASVIVLGSISSFMAYPNETVYCMTKSAVIQLTRGMARELAPGGVRVNALCPGIVGEAGMSHDAMRAAAEPTAVSQSNDATTLLGRPARLEEICSAAVFLAGTESSYITGTSVVVDGGIMA